jgi:hypothetical protein
MKIPKTKPKGKKEPCQATPKKEPAQSIMTELSF